MRIIGGRDYYDQNLTFGHDAETVFVREAIQVSHDEAVKTFGLKMGEIDVRVGSSRLGSTMNVRHGHNGKGCDWTIYNEAVLFCGAIYHGMRVEFYNRHNALSAYYEGRPNGARTTRHFWSFDALAAAFAEIGVTVSARFSPHDENVYDRLRSKPSATADADAFQVIPLEPESLNKVIDSRISVGIYEYTNIGGNRPYSWQFNSDGLKGVEFYRVFPVSAAYQELEMWISGRLLRPEPRTISIADQRIRIEKRGFDATTSFRRAKAQ